MVAADARLCKFNRAKAATDYHFTGEELQVKFLSDSEENSLKY